MTYIHMYTHIHILIFMSSTFLNPCLKRENVLNILTVTITLFKKTLHIFTLNHESSQCSSPHPGPWPVGGAHVHAWVLQGNIWDHEVPSAQNLDPLYTNGASIWRRTSEYQSEHATSSHPPPNFTISPGAVVVVPTQPAPGHYGPWVSSGDALQNCCLVNIDGEVLRSWQDDWLFVDPGGCACSHDHNRDERWCLLNWA